MLGILTAHTGSQWSPQALRDFGLLWGQRAPTALTTIKGFIAFLLGGTAGLFEGTWKAKWSKK